MILYRPMMTIGLRKIKTHVPGGPANPSPPTPPPFLTKQGGLPYPLPVMTKANPRRSRPQNARFGPKPVTEHAFGLLFTTSTGQLEINFGTGLTYIWTGISSGDGTSFFQNGVTLSSDDADISFARSHFNKVAKRTFLHGLTPTTAAASASGVVQLVKCVSEVVLVSPVGVFGGSAFGDVETDGTTPTLSCEVHFRSPTLTTWTIIFLQFSSGMDSHDHGGNNLWSPSPPTFDFPGGSLSFHDTGSEWYPDSPGFAQFNTDACVDGVCHFAWGATAPTNPVGYANIVMFSF